MAAEAIASVVLERLASVALNKLEEHFQLVMGAKNEVKKLTDSFQAIQALLYDAEMKKITNETANAGVSLWLQRFRDAGTDGASTSSNNKKIIRKNNKMGSYFSSCCSCFGKVALRHEIGSKIKELRIELDDIISDRDKLSLNSYLPPAGERLPTSSIIDESDIVATLAQLVFNEDGVKSHFDTVIWVSVSDYFDQTRIAKEIIRGAGVHVPEHLSGWNDDLHKLLCESVKKSRFLLALDDMWTDDDSKWEPFRVAFKNAAQGSRILVITRKKSVADMIGSNYSHLLGILSEKYCWQLLSRLAFRGKNADKVHNEAWINIGKEIANKCKGSAKVLGNHLRVKENIIDWQTVMDNEFIRLQEKAEDGRTNQHVDGTRSYCVSTAGSGGEAVGKEYFNRFIQPRIPCFFYFTWREKSENFEIAPVKTVVDVFAALHPPSLLGKLEIMNYRGSKFSNWIEMLPNLRNLELDHCDCVELPALPSLEHLSMLDMHQLKHIGPEFYGGDGHRAAFPQLNTLRISKAHCLVDLTLKSSRGFDIFPLLHQVDLDDCINLKALPAFGKLPSLEYLNISCLDNVKHIGTEFYGDGGGYAGGVPFPKLRKLVINGAPMLEEWDVFATAGAGPEGVDVMPCLGELELRNCGLKALPALGKLGLLKELYIRDVDNLKHIGSEFYGDAHAKRVAFPGLETLEICGADSLEEWAFGAEECADQITNIMPRLRKIEIRRCGALKKLPALGKLQSLETINTRQMHSLKEIGNEFYGLRTDVVTTSEAVFPKLYKLHLLEMQSLQWWEPGSTEGIMPCLRKLKMTECSNLKSLPQHLSNTLVSLSWNGSNSKIPPRLGQLKALQDLHIRRCSWEYVPTEIKDMHNLRTLDIENCRDLEASCTGDGWKIVSSTTLVDYVCLFQIHLYVDL
ncbi:uncharacterized protein LOC113358860 [Papaver somniferum]|uniref:uncharacterized protein LOC113358860 n=1 Tax=Papaver somniferum TaxID=3469 RepID=UPI000E702CDD|nr:uncharacterized protein LOC113358860 [Papaver somniferum]